MGSFKGAGPDGIKPIVMKNFGPIALREGFRRRRKKQKKCGPRAHFGGGGGSGKIFAGPQFYCDFWKIKPRW